MSMQIIHYHGAIYEVISVCMIEKKLYAYTSVGTGAFCVAAPTLGNMLPSLHCTN